MLLIRGMLHNTLTRFIQYTDQQKVANVSVYDNTRYPTIYILFTYLKISDRRLLHTDQT